jgi:hypothetical protein
MELKEFVSDSLFQIFAGVRDANARAKNESKPTSGYEYFVLSGKNDTAVHFDIAVTVSESKKAGGEGRVTISVVEAALGKGKETLAERVSNISFDVKTDSHIA